MSDDAKNINTFLNNIFRNLNEDEHRIFCASAKSTPGIAKSYDEFMSSRGAAGKACYFSTATAIEDPDYDPDSDTHFSKLRNLKKLFNRLHCVVLDDIGTGPGSKCPPDKLPDLLRCEYSWCVETSPDNFQYGYVLEEPISDINAASDLIRIIYGAGPWDSGGALANKLVRLPCGINLKSKYVTENGAFKVRDTDPTDEPFNTFTPDELLTAVNAGVTWEDVQNGSASKKDPRRTRGTAPWKPGAYLENLGGVVDEVVEFLNAKELIVTEGTDWIEVICPWHEEHSEGTGNTAGYSPLGFGDRPETRGFHCFHGHCSHRTPTEFLEEIAKLGGPEVGYVDHAPTNSVKWVYVANASSGFYFDVKSGAGLRYSPTSWRQMYCDKAFYVDKKGNCKCVPQWKLMEANVLTLHGEIYEPCNELVIEKGPNKFLNLFKRPLWETEKVSRRAYNESTFVDFINYLIPDKDDATWFLDHIASKVQDHTLRGPCAVLTTPIQGSGRGTLSKMLGMLWGSNNIAVVGLGELLGGLAGEGFNDWLRKAYVIVPEAKDISLNPRQEHKAYEALKSGIDPSPTTHVLKTKYGGQTESKVYSSYIICSQHADTLNIPLNDRRFKFISCTTEVDSPENFTKLHKWLETDWQPSIWLMLKNRNIDNYNPFAPVGTEVQTTSEEDLLSQRGSATPINRLVIGSILFAEKYCEGVFCTKLIIEWIAKYASICEAPNTTYWDTQLKKALNDYTAPLGGKFKSNVKFKLDGKNCYLRYTIENKGNGQKSAKQAGDPAAIQRFKEKILDCNAEKFRDFIVELNNEGE